MLELWDLATIIRLTDIELLQLQKDLDSSDPEVSDNAAEVIVQTDALLSKLKSLYEAVWDKDSGYPTYETLVADYRKYPPFN